MKRFWLICLYILAFCAWTNAQEVAEVDPVQLFEQGKYYLDKGDFKNSEKCFLQAQAYFASQSIYSQGYVSATFNLGMLYLQFTMLESAEKSILEASGLSLIIYGKYNLHYANVQNMLGGLYVLKQEYPKAYTCFSTALEVLDFIDKSTIDTLDLYNRRFTRFSTLSNIGTYYLDQGKLDSALYMDRQAYLIAEEISLQGHLAFVTLMAEVGEILMRAGKYDDAEYYLKYAAKRIRNYYGKDHIHNTEALGKLSQLYVLQKQYDKAEKYYREIDRLNRLYFQQSLDFLPANGRQQILHLIDFDYSYRFPRFIYYRNHENPLIAGWGYNNELFIKGLLLQSTNAIKHSIEESTDSTLIYQRNELTTLRKKILSLQEKDPYSTLIPQYEQRAEELEKQIVVNSAAYRENMQQWSITWDSIQKHLGPHQVAIEFMHAPVDNGDAYGALIIRKGETIPVFNHLFHQSRIDTLLPSSTGDSTEIHRTYAYNERGKALSTYVWKGLQYYIHPGDTVFFSPTGILHQIAIENLPNDSTRTMSDVYHLVRLSSTRELVKQRAAIAYKRAVLYGGIDYNTTPEDLGALAVRNMRHSYAYSLPGTGKEVQAISDILTSAQIQTTCNHKNIATEESFKALSGSQPHIIHLATHGFYWQDSTAQQEVYFAQRGITKADNKYAIDPLERCGLLFAGANTALSGHTHRLPQNVEDGVLTAKEISLMDLRGTDLVVLSACETGLGDVTGEGVFGLQRAFKMAGAQTIIMSLWPVNDDATRLLMTKFYHNRITLHQTKQDAFRNAQNSVRTQYPSFYYWAGFILLD